MARRKPAPEPEVEEVQSDFPLPVEAPWVMRRRFMLACMAFCMGVISYVLHYDMRSTVAETAVTMGFMAIISTIGSYCFAATWDDHSKRLERRQNGKTHSPTKHYPGSRRF